MHIYTTIRNVYFELGLFQNEILRMWGLETNMLLCKNNNDQSNLSNLFREIEKEEEDSSHVRCENKDNNLYGTKHNTEQNKQNFLNMFAAQRNKLLRQ